MTIDFCSIILIYGWFILELDETVGDIILKIAVRQNHILQKLIRYMKKHIGTILRTIQLCAELDT